MINLHTIQHLIPGNEYAAVHKMAERINAHRNRHVIRQTYYDGISGLKDLGIAIPPSLRDLEVALGWPQIAIDSLAQRIRMEGFVLPAGDITEYGIDEVMFDNDLMNESTMTTQSSLLQGCTFIATFRGDVGRGDPEVVVQAFAATQATGLWNPTARALGASMLVLNEDVNGASELLVVFPHVLYRFERTNSNSWKMYSDINTMGRVTVQLQRFNPSLDRPFGKSHLSRDMMNITDNAMRTVARAEVNAEFFTSPQRYVLGAHEDAFLDENGEALNAWQLRLGSVMGLAYNDDDEVMPEVGQFNQASQQPHTDSLRMYAGNFAAAAGLPVAALGVTHDNPASAEGVNAVRDDLIIKAEGAARTFTPAWTRAMQDAAQILNNQPMPIEDLKKLTVRWADPKTVSRAQSADAAQKLVASGIIPADSDVALEMVGLSEADVYRIKSHRERAGAPDRIATILGATGAPTSPDDSDAALKEAQTLKAQADALGSLIRAGVKSEDAARLAGITDAQFHEGMVPVTIREAKDDA